MKKFRCPGCGDVAIIQHSTTKVAGENWTEHRDQYKIQCLNPQCGLSTGEFQTAKLAQEVWEGGQR